MGGVGVRGGYARRAAVGYCANRAQAGGDRDDDQRWDDSLSRMSEISGVSARVKNESRKDIRLTGR